MVGTAHPTFLEKCPPGRDIDNPLLKSSGTPTRRRVTLHYGWRRAGGFRIGSLSNSSSILVRSSSSNNSAGATKLVGRREIEL